MQDILDLARSLTKTDTKTLSQKALKAAEEVGELARVVLPLDNAYATTHRFVQHERVLEECADVILTALSVAYDMGFSDEELHHMLFRKSLKWSELQAKASKMKPDKNPYEIHVTVKEPRMDKFRETCTQLGVKPVVLDLFTAETTDSFQPKYVMEDVMTSSAHMGTNRTAFAEMKRITNGLKQAGFSILREKIETVPWHPAAPNSSETSPEMPPNCYFETHFAIRYHRSVEPEVYALAKQNGCYLSRNKLKPDQDDMRVLLATARSYTDTFEMFKEKAAAIQSAIGQSGSTLIENPLIEFSIYDSQVSHDSEWLQAA